MSITGFPAFDQTVAASATLRAKLAEQAAQSSSGKRATTYAGLGADARAAIDLRAALANRAVLSRAAAAGAARANYAQTVLKRLNEIASEATGRAQALAGANPDSRSVTAQYARGALQEVASLLDERYEGEAVFGGSDGDDTPVPQPLEKSGLFQRIGAALAGLGAAGGVATRAALRDLGASDDPDVTPFSARATEAATGAVTNPQRSVPLEDGASIAIGLYPNRNAAAPASTAPDSTGSWARDLIYGLSVLAQIDQVPGAAPADVSEVVKGSAAALRASQASLSEEAGVLGTAEARLAAARTRHDQVAAQLESQVSDVEDVDMAAAITRTQAIQTQLEASYRAIASLGQLSLTKFLG